MSHKQRLFSSLFCGWTQFFNLKMFARAWVRAQSGFRGLQRRFFIQESNRTAVVDAKGSDTYATLWESSSIIKSHLLKG
jgi:hypothetical protein